MTEAGKRLLYDEFGDGLTSDTTDGTIVSRPGVVWEHYDRMAAAIAAIEAEATAAAEQRLAALEGALGRSAEGLHDYALLDPDIGIEHSSTPWTTCPADECAAVLALLAPATATPGEET